MLLQDQLIEVKWCSRNKNYYENLGYIYTGIGTCFNVKAEELLSSDTKVKTICDSCGSIFEWANRYHLRHLRSEKPELCEKCRKTVRDKEWKEIITNYCIANNYELVTDLDSEFINNELFRFQMICPVHGLIETTGRAAKANHLCYSCTRMIGIQQKREATFEARRNKLYDECFTFSIEAGYKLLTPKELFRSSMDIIEYECPIHGTKKMKAGNFARKRHCMECTNIAANKRNKMDISNVIKRVEKCHGKLLNPEVYINQSERNLQIICPECGEPFITSLVLFTQHGGQVCEKCESDESTGERSIRYYLLEKHICFEQEKWFPDCKDLRPLPFDFYLPDYSIAIEFDGYQHYYQNNHFTYTLEEVQKHDAIKNKYCKDKGIKLIRIPYWRIYKLSDILDEELNIPHKDIV